MNVKFCLNSLLILFLFFGVCPIKSQATVLIKEEIPLLEAIEKISREYEVYFTFDMTLVAHVQVEYNHSAYNSAEEALNSILVGTGLKYKFYDERFVILYKEDAEGLESLKQMSHHLDGLISEGEKAVTAAPKRAVRTVSRLSSRFLVRGIESITFSVEGIVTDQNGEPLIGVNIQVKGTNKGIATDLEGRFTLDDIDENAVLVVSYVGYQTMEVSVAGKSNLTITMESDSQLLDEVVVVGYGTEGKSSLTGSVSSVKSETLIERPATNAANLLQGRVTGLQITQPSASPGREDPQILIRGLGSFGASSAPLVLVDGVIGSLSNLNPNDIDNVSVLKDAASAAIYGARAANGVILVTTKSGREGPFMMEYNVNIASQSATKLPDFIYDSYEYMTMYNEAFRRNNKPPLYPQSTIDLYKNPTDKDQYPNFNWVDHYFNPATVINHNLRFTGGIDNLTYNFSLGYLDNPGILPTFHSNRYNAVLNISSQINKVVKIGANINFVKKGIIEPRSVNDDLVLLVYQGAPNYTPFLPDGSGRVSAFAYQNEGHNRNPETDLHPGNAQHTDIHSAHAQAWIKITPFKGFEWHVKGAYNYDAVFFRRNQVPVPQYKFIKEPGETDYAYFNDGAKNGGVVNRYNLGIIPTLFSTLSYKLPLNKSHSMKILAGYEQQSSTNRYMTGERLHFPSPTLAELNAGSPVDQSLSGSASEWAIRSYFGRVNYAYKDKYFLDGNLRYDGTSRIYKDNRWGLFPGVSAGWMISNEDFIRNNIEWIDLFKIRASFGTLGNQEIGLYPYQDILSLTNYPYQSELQTAVYPTRLTDKGLKWESTTINNLGIDASIGNGIFGFSLDLFRKETFDILTTQPVPGSLGLSGPITNDGKLLNKGFELELTHAKKLNEFRYNVNFMISHYKNELLQIRTPTKGINEVGLPYNSFYMYEWIGIFQSEEDIANSPAQPFYPPKPGDLKIKDQNGDNVVNADDRKTIKGRYPDFYYSFGANTTWKAFGLSFFFQGSQGNKMKLNGWGIDPFIQGTPPTKKFRNAWSPTNPSNTIPAIYDGWGYKGVAAYASTYWLHDLSYLRLKNVKLSYALPEVLLNKINFQGATVYISGDNLLTFTKFEGADPETLGHGGGVGGTQRYAQYPQVRILNLGVNIKF